VKEKKYVALKIFFNVPKAQICNKKITVKGSQVEGGRVGVKEVWTFSQV